MFIQIHSLVSYGPSNLNRDDSGKPKGAIVGGVPRLRMSSQSQKRAWRTSAPFLALTEEHLGQRTKQIGGEILDALLANGVDEVAARSVAREVASVFGAPSTDEKGLDKILNQQLTFISAAERKRAIALALAKANDVDVKVTGILGTGGDAVDIAMFGRMLANATEHNVEAAVQVAHAVTTHKAISEDDYYTAVDDLKGDESQGAAFVGVQEFGAGVFYLYVCVDVGLLRKNLGEHSSLLPQALNALLKAVIEHGPRGKISSFASVARPFYVLVERGEQQPRSLVSAFTTPVKGTSLDTDSIVALQRFRSNLDKVYGPCADAVAEINVLDGTGAFDEVAAVIAAV